MDFKHLPMPGGLFAQNPGLLDAFRYIWNEQAQEEKKKKAAKDRTTGKTPMPRNR